MKYKHIFGPVTSRRLGMSLGIDVVPYKYCPLNCVYCEVQHTTHLITERQEFFPPDEIIAEIREVLDQKPVLDHVSFSGAGEPTLYQGLGEIIRFLKQHYPQYKLAMLTNGVMLVDPQVAEVVRLCDVVLPSLDAATQEVYLKIDRPMAGLQVNDLIEGLISFRKIYSGIIWLEVFIIPGVNDNESELLAIANAIDRIKPDQVQVNSLDRPGTETWVKAPSRTALLKVQSFLSAHCSYPVEIISKSAEHGLCEDVDRSIAMKVRDHLLAKQDTAEGISLALGVHINEISKTLRCLNAHEKLTIQRKTGDVFYRWKD